ncbi:MAG TPA: hypothetical protein VHA56_10535 [Mucilaginibacter sp.]|nr:hypothetical protein [Mucilaginibacter sp.]
MNKVLIKKEFKESNEPLADRDISKLRLFLVDKENGSQRNGASFVYINNIEFKADAQGNYIFKLLPGSYTMKIKSVQYYPQTIKLKMEAKFNYDITML